MGRLTFHDFRVVPGTTHTNMIFDVVVPFGIASSDEQLMKQITDLVHEQRPECYAVITFDHAYTSDEKREEGRQIKRWDFHRFFYILSMKWRLTVNWCIV